MRRRSILLVLALCLPATPARAQSSEAQPLELELPVVQKELENGLRVLVLEDHAIPNAALYIGWRVGSRNERPGITGLAHYFEHMMFSGGARFGAGRFDPLMEAAGGSNNAYTTNDVTVYMDWFPAARLPLLLDMEADRMRAMRFDPALVETERGVVASERRLTVEEPVEVLREALWAAAYTAHPYQWPVLGWMSDIEGWEQSDLEAFFATHYVPNHCVLVLVGDVDADEALAAIEARMGPLKRGDERPPLRTPEPPQRGERRVEVEVPDASVGQLMVGWHVPSTNHPDFPVLVVLERLLLAGESSRLNLALVQQAELCLDLAGGWQGLQFDPSLFTVELTLRPGVPAITAETGLYNELRRLRESGPRADELETAKRGLLLKRLDELTTIDGKANLLLDTELFFGGWRNLPARLRAVQAVTAADVQRVMARYLHRRNRTVVTLRLETSPDAPAEPDPELETEPEAESEAPAATAPPPVVPALDRLPPRALRLAEPSELTLDNGLRVLLLPDPRLPLVHLQARILRGGAHDPAGRDGLSQVLAGSILRGAGELDAEDFQRAVEGLGGELTAEVLPEALRLEGRFLAPDVDTALELLADVLRRPRLDPAEVQHELAIQLAELTALRDDPQRALATYWRRWSFADHPWGRPLSGDERSLRRLEQPDVLAAARATLQPGRIWLSVSGDFDPDLVAPRLEQLLGDWRPEPEEPPPAIGPAPAQERDRVLLVDDPGALQTYFMFGGQLFDWRDADYPARLLANTILGGRFTSRLNTALRIDTGLTYGARSRVDDERGGVLAASSYTAVETSREALELARDVYLRFARAGITQAELDSARSYLQGQLAPDWIETPAQQAKLQLDLRLADLGDGRVTGLFAALDALTLEQVNRVITERFPRRLSWTVIGPATTLRGILADFGELTQTALANPGFGPESE